MDVLELDAMLVILSQTHYSIKFRVLGPHTFSVHHSCV